MTGYMDKQTNRERQAGKQTDRQIDGMIDTYIHIYAQICVYVYYTYVRYTFHIHAYMLT